MKINRDTAIIPSGREMTRKGRSLWRQALFLLIIAFMVTKTEIARGQDQQRVIRVARLVIDSSQLDNYKSALREGMEAAMKLEPGVLMLYAVYEKEHPNRVMVFEIYASQQAYEAHRETAHFKKYKDSTREMVKSLELLDMSAINLLAKPGL